MCRPSISTRCPRRVQASGEAAPVEWAEDGGLAAWPRGPTTCAPMAIPAPQPGAVHRSGGGPDVNTSASVDEMGSHTASPPSPAPIPTPQRGSQPPRSRRNDLIGGTQAMLPWLVGVVPFGMVVGMTARTSDVSTAVGLATGATIYSGSAQLTAIGLIGDVASIAVVVASVLIINAPWCCTAARSARTGGVRARASCGRDRRSRRRPQLASSRSRARACRCTAVSSWP